MSAKRGLFVAVVGGSGVGKDSVLHHAKKALADEPDIHFVRRIVTRSGSDAEDNQSVTAEQFELMLLDKAFSVTWQAHDLSYGLPISVLDDLEAGHMVIANGSRRALENIRSAFGHVHVVEIVADPAIVAQRLAARGRASDGDIAKRMTRVAEIEPDHCTTLFRIENNGALKEAGDALLSYLRALKAGQAAA